MDRIEKFIDSDEATELKESLKKISDTEIPQEVKDKIMDRSGKMGDKLSEVRMCGWTSELIGGWQNEKTRELAATLVNITDGLGDSMAVRARGGSVLRVVSCEAGETVEGPADGCLRGQRECGQSDWAGAGYGAEVGLGQGHSERAAP